VFIPGEEENKNRIMHQARTSIGRIHHFDSIQPASTVFYADNTKKEEKETIYSFSKVQETYLYIPKIKFAPITKFISF
jgi:hypothetical protein